jgi:quercetin dioxygenase-like cupin family protein
MKIEGVPFAVTDWNRVSAIEHKGRAGTSFWRSFEEGCLRVRVVDYSPGFEADHWCPRGHILYVLEGELRIALKSGAVHKLGRGMSFAAGNDESDPHLASSPSGARVFIVD